MRISDLLSLGRQYLFLGLVVLVILAAIFLLVYFKFLKGKKKVAVKKLLWWGVFICYLTVVLGVTLMDRGSFWQNGSIMPLFYSYKDAWINFSLTAWRNIILNICMFIPLGFLLPLGLKFFRSFWKTYLAGFLLTLFIEGMQFSFHLGMFELDDIMNNAIGAMIGYGLYALVKKLRSENAKVSSPKLAALQLPLLITLACFTIIFVSYEKQELGNVSGQYITTYDPEKLSIITELDFDQERSEAPVYQSKILSKDESVSFATEFFANLGSEIDESRNDFYEDTAVFYSKDVYNLWVNYQGGSYSFTDFETSFSEKPLAVKSDATEAELRSALITYGIEVPENAELTVDQETSRFTFQIGESEETNTLSMGSISGTYYENERFADINYSVVTSEYYKDFPIISEQDAFEMIADGKWNYYESGELQVRILDCTLDYTQDSKGFYQPVYVFACEINGQETSITIAAIQN